MDDRPIIGVATQTMQPIPGQLPLAWVMGQKYVRTLTAAGAIPWVIPLLPDDEPILRGIYDRLDGVFLAGGVDIDPTSYNEARHDKCGPSDRDRDRVEMQLVQWAAVDSKPVLGVCRGAQMLNVALGGSLYQDLAAEESAAIKHDYFPIPPANHTRDQLVHAVRIERGTKLRRIMGVDYAAVNSMHHQGIKTVAPGVTVNAVSPDGLVEGIEGANGRFALGLQWHPEELAETDGAMRAVFAAFVAAAREYRLQHAPASASP